jgi:eukaryotic-like serine/threonine-protein kinase
LKQPEPDQDSSLGKVFLGKYRIVRLLARGGMGTIYLARNEGAAGFVKPVVVKRILPGSVDAMALRMFEREARIMSHLRHPGIVDVIDFSAEDDGYLMVLDYVHGYHLGKWYRWVQRARGPFAVDVAVHVMANVLDALHYAHTLTDTDGNALRVIHRDIKPSNIMTDVEGHVKLLDFGIAQMVTDRTEQTDTTQVVKGTFAYLAPELLRSGGEPTALSDVYACGVVLHEVLSGRNEFRQPDLAMTAARVLRHEPRPLADLRNDVTPALSAVIAEAMEKDPNRRHGSAQEFAKALRAARKLDGEKAAEQVAREVWSDYRDPDFIEALGVDSLDALERAWKNPPDKLLAAPSTYRTRTPVPGIVGPDDETRAIVGPGKKRAVSQPSLATVGGRKRIPAWAWLAVIVAVGAVAGAAAVVRFEKEPPAPVVQVHAFGNVTETATAPEVEAKEAGSEAGAGAGAEAGPEKTTVRPVAKRKGALEDPFRAYEWDIETQCMQRHTALAQKFPQLSVRFSVDRAGVVEDADLKPEAAEKTELGACVLGFARKTRFDKQAVAKVIPAGESRVGFSVPLRVRPQ